MALEKFYNDPKPYTYTPIRTPKAGEEFIPPGGDSGDGNGDDEDESEKPTRTVH